MTAGDWASLFFTSTLALFGTSVALLVAWLRARERAIRAETPRGQQGARRQTYDDHAPNDIEAIAAEVARLGEGQEFLVQLMKERRTGEVHSTVHPPSY